jgi:hypothetical protein
VLHQAQMQSKAAMDRLVEESARLVTGYLRA